MDDSTFDFLCETSQLSFSDAEKENYKERLARMIKFAGAVKNYDCGINYDGVVPASVSLNELREDKAAKSMPPEKLLENTEGLFDCYVIPKLME